MRLKITILILFITNLSHAQIGSGNSKFCIEIAPLSWLANLEGYSYQLGTEFRLDNHLSGYVSGEGYFRGGDGDRSNNVRGYNVRLELKYYFNRDAGGQYVSIEGMYKKQEFNWQDSIHTTPAYQTTFRVSKDVSCLTAKYGCQFLHKSRIVLDCFVGLGVRFKNVTTTLTQQQVNGLKYNDDSSYESDEIGYLVKPGMYVLPNLEAGFKIGYQIN
ncbi:MAG TPA: DUF3575 domain-containing protein [Bacteroidia bacterium]|jgi:hypothetical protein|nr:DUF3575 domain-containing protein [Bacteroidia bacterium]